MAWQLCLSALGLGPRSSRFGALPAPQVVDARDPLLYRSTDLEGYARDLHASKASLVLLNKADLLPVEVREAWADFFDQVRSRVCVRSGWVWACGESRTLLLGCHALLRGSLGISMATALLPK